MKILIDPNVLVSAAVTGRNPEVVILFILANPDYEWVVSKEILTEYKEVLSRSRLKLTQQQREKWFNILDAATKVIDVNIEIDFPTDQKDAKFLACAAASEADFLITGDKDFTEDQTLVNTTIISVSLFKRLICDVRELSYIEIICLFHCCPKKGSLGVTDKLIVPSANCTLSIPSNKI